MPTRFNPPTEARIPIAAESLGKGEGSEEWAGRRVGPYLVQRKLSQGGMGVVLLALDEALRRPVALKVMGKGLLNDNDALKRFEREARATASVQHRNIAQVYLVGLSEDGLPFLAMEFVDGGSLLDAMRAKRQVTFSQIAGIMEQVAAALQAAHKMNIVHRDIKPGNIMLTAEGEVRVVDFGLAKIFFEDSYMTQEGVVLGTPSYMAPEQSQGRVVDHRADIYSLGATIYHLTAGRPPFTADSPVQIMMKHVTAPLISMRSLNPAIPVEFDEVVGRCMRKDVDDRYQDYESLLTDIRRVRLMCLSREHGAFIGNEAGLPAVPPSPGLRSSGPASSAGSSGSVSLPPAPGRPPRPASFEENTVRVRMAPGATPFEALPEEPEASGWTPLRIGLTAGAGIVALGAIAMALLPGTPAPEPPSEPRKNAVTILIDKAAQQTRGGVEVAPGSSLHPNWIAYEETSRILSTLHDGIRNFQLAEGRMPYSLPEIANENRVIMIFTTDEQGNPLDAWNTPISLQKSSGELRSAGIDGSLMTTDDIVLPLEGKMLVPDVYEALRNH